MIMCIFATGACVVTFNVAVAGGPPAVSMTEEGVTLQVTSDEPPGAAQARFTVCPPAPPKPFTELIVSIVLAGWPLAETLWLVGEALIV